MNQEQQESLDRFTERYVNGEVPWDDTMPPPEVLTMAESVPPGQALDLGCGYGRTSIYLAQQGWRVDGVDFVPQAIAGAQKRADEANVGASVQFHVGSVADLHFLAGPYDLAIDIGCMHSLSQPLLEAYRDGLLRLLRPGALYLLFAHLRDEEPEDAPYRWVTEEYLRSLLADFTLENCELGVTVVNENRWRSGWFWYRR
ncbi:MAG: class I SAM-dependent methyltransferase [Chloroflexota bacterium]